ncbi:uncharacterized protein LAJ45_11080 [Morchella importuna]|uniref:uncharacterized protein n=1 Tax=Morchella importuna TaxID=1174673 RepID=UPI001E8E55DC|nr:uncharacterized protein LAJ45_11080 [Morchella importuna]KAH8144875.1 hypothetical protein LAJ45_11080 [Morchella importuna]
MSSIFTFNPSPPKPASPWANNTPIHPSPSTTPSPLPAATESITDDTPGHLKTNSNSGRFRGSFIDANHKRWGEGIATDDGGVVRGLISEPQMGPTEYKLSLIRGGKSEARMDQLTTQLLWRLQQSSPYHGNSLTSKSPGAISSLLQESQGALYEIGVADDGTFVGLSEEELHASLDTLRGMAARLGCSVTVVRKVCVGTVDGREIKRAEAKLAEYIKARQRNQKITKMIPEDNYNGGLTETIDGADTEKFGIPRLGDSLWVAEAFVKPGDGSPTIPANVNPEDVIKLPETKSNTEQLRITLTGATTCGKTTLLGTLSTGELDNGRGKSRLSLLRHRHELVSGITSSVAWEIVGYRPEPPDTNNENLTNESGASRIVNYASGNISSWTDIHASAVGGRIAFLSDSAGNTRFIKATFRSLIGWAPHYAAYLIAANSEDDSSGVSGHGVHAHLTLCTKLGLRMLVVITKMDLASKTGLKKVFSSVLTYLKEHGKKPALIPSMKTLKDVTRDVEMDPEHVVPILFTSSVKGDGIDLLHALIASLPLPESLRAPVIERVIEPLPGTSLVGVTTGTGNLSVVDNGEGMTVKVDVTNDKEELPSTLFHVEEIYGIQPAYGNADTDGGAVVGGHVRYGKISIGDELVIGPFPPVNSPPSRSGTPTPTATPIQNLNLSTSAGHLSRQFSKSPDSGDERRVRITSRQTPTPNNGEDDIEDISGGEFEWKTVKIISVRRLRLPVNTLYTGEAGTLGAVPILEESSILDPVLPIDLRDINSKLRITIDEDSDCSDSTHHLSGTPKSMKAVTFANPPPTNIHHLPMKLRRGMVILNRPSTKLWPKAHVGFTTKLEDPDACNSLVIGSSAMVYIASIRVAARVASIEPPPPPVTAIKRKDKSDDALGVFSLDDEFDSHSEDENTDDYLKERLYTFEFNHRAEWIEEDATVLIMPGGGEKGLEAFVGKVLNRLV